MQHHQSIEDIDRLLDELEQLAASNVSSSIFLQKLLARLRFLVQADAVALMLPDRNGNWFAIAFNGNGDPAQVGSFRNPGEVPASETVVSSQGNSSILGVSVRKHTWEKGALWVRFPARLPDATVGEVGDIIRAFAEIVAIRQLSEQELFLDQNWSRLQRLVRQITSSRSVENAAFELVNGLPGIIGANRASLMVRRGMHHARVLAVSGVARLDQRADLVKTISRIGQKAISDAKPVVNQEVPAEETADDSDQAQSWPGLFRNHLCLPLVSGATTDSSQARARPTAALLLEWEQSETFLRNVPLLDHAIPMLEACWGQHTRWLRVPALFRQLASTTGSGAGANSFRGLIRLAVVIVLLSVAFWFLTRPTTLRVESKGTLQPALQRAIYVGMEGFVDEVLVSDGQMVSEGELLVRLRSPEISQNIQELLDDAIAVREKRSGLNIDVNQLSQDSPRFMVEQNRLSSEIRLLDIQLENLKQKQEFWESQQRRLEIRAPIDGKVVARQLREYLDGRPVKNGDQLFRIVDFDGPWRLELLVADRDFGQVARNFPLTGDADGNQANRKVDFVFASDPEEWFQCDVAWISDSARNPDGTGGVVDLYCDIDQATALRGRMGATVYTYFDCGKQPFWFVWSRGLVESIQRRIWF